MKSRTKYFHTKGFVSFLTMWSFLVLGISGIILYFTPAGRVANWSGWTIIGFTKEGWGGLHTITALLFIVTIVFHLIFNWKVLMNYFRERYKRGIRLKKELSLSLSVMGLFFMGSVFQIQPFWKLMDVNESIKDYWDSVHTSAPVPHMEQMTLSEIAETGDVPVVSLMEKLSENNIAVTNTALEFSEIAVENGMTPDELYALLDIGNGTDHTVMEGSLGLGRLSLEEYCAQNRIDLAFALKLLAEKDIEASASDNLRELAENHNMKPYDLIEIITGLKESG
ncbi:DUF4405 domain-containing protein [candidate division KSB1 bacterium]